MGRKHTPGLFKRKEVWHIDKIIFGKRICESTGTSSLFEAECYLAQKVEQVRNAHVFGIRPERTFREAAVKYLKTHLHNASIDDDARHIAQLDKYIGKLPLTNLHDGTLASFVKARKEQGRKNKTINLALEVVRKILNLAAKNWRDDAGLTWLAVTPKITMQPLDDSRLPYPLSWDEQDKLLGVLPLHLRRMALFKVNTGCREQEVCQLRWDWEIEVPELNTSVFIIPAWLDVELPSGEIRRTQLVKNGEDRLVVLNHTAKAIIDEVRGIHPEFVFTYQYKKDHHRPMTVMNNTAWRNARDKVGLPQVRVHDLKHTFGHRLRTVGVTAEDRKDLLGHKSREITTHYSAVEIGNLIEAANKVCGVNGERPAITVLKLGHRSAKVKAGFASSRKNPASFAIVDKVINNSLCN